jgi:tetratricopeptide (TPR) repeat protein
MGDVYERTRAYETALELFRRSVDLYLDLTKRTDHWRWYALAAHALFRCGNIMVRQKRWDDAAEAFASAEDVHAQALARNGSVAATHPRYVFESRRWGLLTSRRAAETADDWLLLAKDAADHGTMLDAARRYERAFTAPDATDATRDRAQVDAAHAAAEAARFAPDERASWLAKARAWLVHDVERARRRMAEAGDDAEARGRAVADLDRIRTRAYQSASLRAQPGFDAIFEDPR